MSVTELQDIPRESAPSQKRRGPRTVSGKARVALNALKHGRRSRPGRHLEMLSASMAELGEDPQEFRLLRQKLLESFQPSTALAAPPLGARPGGAHCPSCSEARNQASASQPASQPGDYRTHSSCTA